MAFAGEFDGCYRPIAEHGLVGDLHTVALVGTDGTIDWYCCPHFDSPSVFASILDRERGGYWRIAPTLAGWTSKQLYVPDTNVLITRFLSAEGVGELQCFMPVVALKAAHRHRVVRRAVCVRGEMQFRLEVAPRFNYGRDPHRTTREGDGVVFRSDTLTLALQSELELGLEEGDATCEFVLRAGESATFVLERIEGDEPHRYSEAETAELLDDTIAYWRGWLARSRYGGRWREMVHRSALTLKLLTYRPTGAIVAAPTTSLPELIGGGRNWDYRYTWIRDAAFSLYGLLRLGFTEEAEAFMGWLTERFREREDGGDSGPLQVLYGIDGRSELPELELPHLEGYRGSAPVRIGNAASRQRQLDIYGELIDSVYLYNKYGTPIFHDAWTDLARIVEWVCEHWDTPDEGIWETRGGRRNFTFSRLMSWVAVERAIRIARQRGLPADMGRWLGVRDAIYHQVMKKGWNAERGAFVQHYDTEVLDASLLLMPLVKFISPTDPRWLSTLDRISEELVLDSLVYRYSPEAAPDGVDGDEGSFSMCSFWYVEALGRAGRTEEARLVFEKMLSYASPLGLYAEEIGPAGELLGNFPQAFTHLALISAAFDLDRRLG